MDYLLTIVHDSNNKYGALKNNSNGKLLFVFTNVEKEDTELLYKSYYAEPESELSALAQTYDNKPKGIGGLKFDFESILKRTIDEFVEFVKRSNDKLYINFENNSIELSIFFKKNYPQYVMKRHNVFGEVIRGTVFTQTVKDAFTNETCLNLVRTGLAINDFTISKSKNLF